jgi:hypothetical protein
VTIAKSVRIQGSGPAATTIRGGGPVLTIGDLAASRQPTVAIDGLKITGGVMHGDGNGDGDVPGAAGGGIDVPPGPGFTIGATVRISHAVVTGNRVEPARTEPIGPPCPGGPCPFAQSSGGGIANFGTMTVTDTLISDNEAGGIASDAIGGGVSSFLGSLSLTRVAVTGNRAVAGIPNGRFAEGGGVFVESGALTVRHSLIGHNVAALTSDLPSFAGDSPIDMSANSGGIHVGDGIPTTIEDTALVANEANANDPHGEPLAFDSAMLVGHSPLTMRRTLIARNRSVSTSASTRDPGPGGSALELDGGGTIADARIVNNTSSQTSVNGDAGVNGALAILNFDGNPKLVTVRDTVISHNTAVASTTTGAANAQGAGVFNDSLLELDHVDVHDNTGRAEGPSGRAEGGGIWNGAELNDPPVELTLDRTSVTRNTLIGSPGIAIHGGGLFTTLPISVRRSRIADNAPDQCFGC